MKLMGMMSKCIEFTNVLHAAFSCLNKLIVCLDMRRSPNSYCLRAVLTMVLVVYNFYKATLYYIYSDVSLLLLWLYFSYLTFCDYQFVS